MDADARIDVLESFRISGRGEVVIYREVEGHLTAGTEVVSEQRGDRWRVTSLGPGFGPPRYTGSPPLKPRPHLLFRPLADARRIQPGETFRAVESPEIREAEDGSGCSPSEADQA